MATYLILNVVFLALAFVALGAFRTLVWNRSVRVTLIVLLITTLIFDSLIIISDIVAYNPELMLGINLGAAPVEDFFYAMMAVLLIPSLWKVFDREKKHE